MGGSPSRHLSDSIVEVETTCHNLDELKILEMSKESTEKYAEFLSVYKRTTESCKGIGLGYEFKERYMYSELYCDENQLHFDKYDIVCNHNTIFDYMDTYWALDKVVSGSQMSYIHAMLPVFKSSIEEVQDNTDRDCSNCMKNINISKEKFDEFLSSMRKDNPQAYSFYKPSFFIFSAKTDS